MKQKNCKIVCDGVEIASIDCRKDGFSIKCTDEGKEMCKDICKGCC